MAAKTGLKVALVGTTSLRGREIKRALEESDWALQSVELYDPDIEEEYSRLSQFRDEAKAVRALTREALEGRDIVFFAADPETNRSFARLAGELGFLAVDLNESFSDQSDVPLAVTGINDRLLEARPSVVSNPHPLVIILAHLLTPLERRFGLDKAIAFVLQPASAFDEPGIEELAGQSLSLLSGTSLPTDVFKQQSAFNLLSYTSKPDRDGFSPRERQVMAELARVMENPRFPLSLSIVQASLFHTYAVMCYLELRSEAGLGEFKAALAESPLIKDSASDDFCSVSCISVTGKDGVFVGQVKREERFPRGFWVWAVADNLTRGSALNALEAARKLLDRPVAS
jgi:aspartate-semialdehyde dehydrogenase